jgi:heterodisulfide reductase subunit B
MKFAWFPGCKIPHYQPQYELSTRAVLDALGIRLAHIEFNCCGYPIRHQNFKASVLSAARNMAIANQHHQTILTPCKCCYGNLKHGQYWMKHHQGLRHEITRILAEEGLKWDDGIRVVHLLSVLAHDVKPEMIRARVNHPLTGLKVAAHYGCHALRPGNVTRFDDPLAPTIFEKLVDITGAESINWPLRLECCGNPLWEKNNRLSIRLMNRKLRDAAQSGADIICTACTYCQIQFDTVQAGLLEKDRPKSTLPAILYPQLLGLSLGLNQDVLGLR